MRVREKKFVQGQVLGDRYRIDSLIGEGGMSSVYLADDLKLPGKRWAIKQSSIMTRAGRLQWIEEAKMLTQLQHPHLPQIIDFFPPDEEGFSYVVMEYVHGETLEARFLNASKRMDVQELINFAIQICDLFRYLHQMKPQPVVYRDLKPSNVMVDERGHVWLIDFGIARSFKAESASDTVQIGTVGFAAPEQFEQQQSDWRTDLYALGAVMYYLLSGGRYFFAERKPLDELRSDLPAELLQVVSKLLRSEPKERYQSAGEVAIELGQVAVSFETMADGKGIGRKRVRGTGQRVAERVDPVTKKLIVVGGLYPGAGSTFVTFALAKALSDYGIGHSVVEYPLNEPEHYTLLQGDRRAPHAYSYLAERVLHEAHVASLQDWADERSVWYPANPLQKIENWHPEHMFKLLYKVKTVFTILDVSHHFDDPIVQQVCASADEVVCVVDALPAKLNHPRTIKMAQFVHGLEQTENQVAWIANREPKQKSLRAKWLKSLPFNPLCILPAVPYDAVMEAIWNGKLVQDEPEIRRTLINALHPLLNRLLPTAHLIIPEQSRRSGWFSKRS